MSVSSQWLQLHSAWAWWHPLSSSFYPQLLSRRVVLSEHVSSGRPDELTYVLRKECNNRANTGRSVACGCRSLETEIKGRPLDRMRSRICSTVRDTSELGSDGQVLPRPPIFGITGDIIRALQYLRQRQAVRLAGRKSSFLSPCVFIFSCSDRGSIPARFAVSPTLPPVASRCAIK